jgi:hypothetical protein
MQGITSAQEHKASFKIDDLTVAEKDRLVGAFVWLIKEDKKQNPALYQIKKEEND